MTIITRFAPSPTGYLHIGGARTALFNYLFARHNGGKFLLRIEDTDKERSTKAATEAIFNSLKWLGLEHDDEVVFQSERQERHMDVAYELVKAGRAYYCFSSQEEIAKLREAAIAKKEHFIFHSPWRDVDASKHPKDIKPVVRLKALREGVTVVKDLLQGDVTVQNDHLDDMILLRSDGTPTYMLAVVVDDHDMKITHIIRGDDHLSNAHRQQILYEACGFEVPKMVHIPLIHGSDGAKLSKRHGALGVENYKDMGYLPEALCNYLLRLGWSHGDDEIINRNQAIKWFSIEGLGKAPARLDFGKMRHLNAHYLRQKDNEVLAEMVVESIRHCETPKVSWQSQQEQRALSNILKAMDSMKPRAELLDELVAMSRMYINDFPFHITDEAKEIIANTDEGSVTKVIEGLEDLESFTKDNIQTRLKEIAENMGIKLGELMHFVRAFIAGDTKSPSVFEMIEIIGKEETMRRLRR